MQSQSLLFLGREQRRLVAIALLCLAIVLLHSHDIVKLLAWTQPVLRDELRPLHFLGLFITVLALQGASGTRRRAILLIASLAAMTSFSPAFAALSLFFFAVHYALLIAPIHRAFKIGFLLATVLAWALACDTALWPELVSTRPAIVVFGYVFAVNYTFRLFYFHHEMKLRNFERVPFNSYLLYMIFAPYFIVLPYMLAIPRFRNFESCLDKADESAIDEGIKRIARGIVYATLWYLFVALFDPRAEIAARVAARDWSVLALLALFYAPGTFFSVVGEAYILIGLINLLGVSLAPPFKNPLAATSVLDWWKRWNTHFRDFLVDLFYYPLLVRWRTRNRYLTIVTGCFLVFVVGSSFFHWAAKYYFTHASHQRLMSGVVAENVFMFGFVAIGLCLEQLRISRRKPRIMPGRASRALRIAATWSVLALAVVGVGKGVDHLINSNPEGPATDRNTPMQEQEPIREAIRNFIATISIVDPSSDQVDLIETGVIDSVRVLDLINFVADSFSIEVSERDIYDGRFASIASIADFVAAGPVATA